MTFNEEVDIVTNAIGAMLKEKNAAYGDSALNPVRILSKASPVEQLYVRIDDKLSRIARGREGDEDVIKDLIGYLLLVIIQRNRALREGQPTGGTTSVQG